MLSLWLFGALICACVALLVRARIKAARAHAMPPTFSGTLPLIGITHLTIRDTAYFWQVMKWLAEDSLRQGGVIKTTIGKDLCYFITDPDDALTVANSCLTKHYIYNFAKSWLGNGLITSSGSIWQRHRKIMNPGFSLPVIHSFLDTFNYQSRKMLSKIHSNVGKGLFEASPYIKVMVLTSSCITISGVSNLFDEEEFSEYAAAVDRLLWIGMQRFQKFWLHNEYIYQMSSMKKEEDKLVGSLHKATAEIIQKKKWKKEMESKNILKDELADGIAQKSLIDVVLQFKDKLSDTEVREELDTTIVASYETTSYLVESILILLGSHSEVQERVFEEVIQVLGLDRNVEKEDLNKLVYTDAVIKESLRLIPVVPILPRYADFDVKIKNYTIPAGSQCIILTNGIHMHPAWGPDVKQFRPERWLDVASLPKNPSYFSGFSIGKRNCIGKTYAMTSIKVFLSHFIRRYKIQSDHTKLEFQLNTTLKPIAGNEISIQQRY